MYACFVDFSKAFETVWRKGLLYKLMLNGLSYKFIKLIENMYQRIKCSVKLSNGTTPLFNSYVGLRKGLLYKLMLNGLSYKFIKLIENMYQRIKCSVKLSNGTTPLFNSSVGLRQGCNLSPMLFNLFINDIFYIFYDNS